MSIYFPKQKVALDIVDDPGHRCDHDEDWTVVKTSIAELQSYEGCRQVMDEVAHLLGSSAPEDPEWEEKNRRLYHALLAHCA